MINKKENKAREILIENNWFRDYYYIKQVIESCENDVLITNGTRNPIKSVMNARKWGFNHLCKVKDKLCDKYPKLRNAIEEIYYGYTEELRDIFENTFDKISDKLVKKQ
jgi:hypothetical protein